MKDIIQISKDLSVPLTEPNVEWNLYVYKKRYKTVNKIKTLDSYEMYKIDLIDLVPIYSDIHAYVMRNYINSLEICDYSSEMPKQRIGYIDLNNNNILKSSLDLIDIGKDNAVQFNSRDLALHGYILECKISGNIFMQIFSSSNPIKIYRNKYSILFKSKFSELTDPVLTINSYCDCILFNNYCLFFSGKAENIFDLEKHYKALASKCLNNLKSSGIVADIDTFVEYASAWPKAANFETYDKNRIEKFATLTTNARNKILSSFDMKTDKKGAIIADTPDSKEKILKFVCNKYLRDFNDEGYEVTYPQKINHQV